MSKKDISDQDVIHRIAELAGDDFCDDLECQAAFAPEKMTATERMAENKLGMIYRLAHSFDKSASCYRVHGDWRGEMEKPGPVPNLPEELTDGATAEEITKG